MTYANLARSGIQFSFRVYTHTDVDICAYMGYMSVHVCVCVCKPQMLMLRTTHIDTHTPALRFSAHSRHIWNSKREEGSETHAE